MRAALDGVLHRGLGKLLVAESTSVGAAVHGRGAYLAGDPRVGGGADGLLEKVGRPFRFTYDHPAWKDVLLQCFGPDAETVTREAFESSSLDPRRAAPL